VNHETDAEDCDRDAEVEGEPLEAAGVADQETDDDGPEAGADAVNIDDWDRLAYSMEGAQVKTAYRSLRQ
jgi:hypothetical protein